MFKMVALLGLVAGAGAYGLYTQTDLFCCHDDDSHSCCVSAKKPCCDGTTPVEPACCGSHSECCDVTALSCVAGSAISAAVPSKTENCAKAKVACDTAESCCVTAKPVAVVKTPTCCDEPCPACAARSLTAKGAVAGPAALVIGSLK